MASKLYQYYQPNSKDVKDKYGDCTIRALSKALGKSWIDTFDTCLPLMREYQVVNPFFAPINIRKEIMDKLGFDYIGVSNKGGSTRPTVKQFASNHKDGAYVLNVANHEVACVNGKYYDTWDSGECKLYGYFIKR